MAERIWVIFQLPDGRLDRTWCVFEPKVGETIMHNDNLYMITERTPDGRFKIVYHEDDIDFSCKDCGMCTAAAGEYYMVHDHVWHEAMRGRKRWREGFLCVGCLERRLGRTLVRSDFPDAPINWDGMTRKSDRLVNRLRKRLRIPRG